MCNDAHIEWQLLGSIPISHQKGEFHAHAIATLVCLPGQGLNSSPLWICLPYSFEKHSACPVSVLFVFNEMDGIHGKKKEKKREEIQVQGQPSPVAWGARPSGLWGAHPN